MQDMIGGVVYQFGACTTRNGQDQPSKQVISD